MIIFYGLGEIVGSFWELNLEGILGIFWVGELKEKKYGKNWDDVK